MVLAIIKILCYRGLPVRECRTLSHPEGMWSDFLESKKSMISPNPCILAFDNLTAKFQFLCRLVSWFDSFMEQLHETTNSDKKIWLDERLGGISNDLKLTLSRLMFR